MDLHHEPAGHMHQIVAMEQPVARIIGNEFGVVLLHVTHGERVLEGSGYGAAVDSHNLKRVTVQVHRVIFHAHAEDAESHTLARLDVQRVSVGEVLTVDRPVSLGPMPIIAPPDSSSLIVRLGSPKWGGPMKSA